MWLAAKREQNGVVKSYLTLGTKDGGRNSRILKAPITVIGKRIKVQIRVCKVRLTLNPAKTFDVEDRVEEEELEG
jgi:hypothetical protein